MCCFAEETIVLATGEFPPLESESLIHYGLVPRIVTEAFRSEGVSVEFKFFPWKRAYEASRKGKVNGTFQWFQSSERVKDHYYSAPILEEIVVWFHLKSHPFDWNTLADMKDVEIGAIRGFTYNPEFYKAIDEKQIKVQFVTKHKQNFDKMLVNHIEVFPETIDVGLYEITKNYPPETVSLFTYHRKPFHTTTNHLLLPRNREDSPRLLEKFNQGLKKLKENGKFEQYLLESRQGAYSR